MSGSIGIVKGQEFRMREFRIQKFRMKALVILALRVLTPKQLKFPVKFTLCLGASCLPLFTRSHTSGHDIRGKSQPVICSHEKDRIGSFPRHIQSETGKSDRRLWFL